MKKAVALILALGMTALLFAACGESASTTTAGTTVNTTTVSGENPPETTTTGTPVETTTANQGPLVFADEDMIDSVSFGYFCKVLRDENGEVLGLAATGWKSEKASINIVFESKYSTRDAVGNVIELPLIQVGVGQGLVSFQGRLETVVIEEGVTKIGNKAFPGCSKLKSVTLPDGLLSIGEMAFWNCGALESIEIPSTVTEIGKYAFSDCVNLKSVTIPERFRSQEANLFDGCPNVVITYTN